MCKSRSITNISYKVCTTYAIDASEPLTKWASQLTFTNVACFMYKT